MLNALLSIFAPTYTPPTFDPWQRVRVPKSDAKPVTGPILTNEETRTFDWLTGTKKRLPVEVVATVTPYDAALLAERGHNNHDLNANLKAAFHAGNTAAQMARACGCSLDYAKKVRGAFGKALENQKADTGQI